MRYDQQRETDDFLAAKKLLAVELQLDGFVQGLTTTFLREECQPETRKSVAEKLLRVAKEKDNPPGWLRSVLENKTALAAIRAIDSRDYRTRKRDDGEGVKKHEIRSELRLLYEARHGPISGSKLLDGDGGMAWADFLREDPHLAAAIRARLQKRQEEFSWEVEQNGVTYSLAPSLSMGMWREVFEEFRQATNGMREAGLLAPNQTQGLQSGAIQL